MKTVKKISGILRAAGVVLLCLALVASIYVSATNSAAWNKGMKGMLADSGVKTNYFDRVRFDVVHMRAMSSAVASKEQAVSTRAHEIEHYYADFAAKAAEAEVNLHAEQETAVLNFFEQEFDYSAFVEKYAQLENLEESRDLREIFEYLDSFSAPPKKGKLAVKVPSCKEWFEEYYVAFVNEHAMPAEGEVTEETEDPAEEAEPVDVGTWLEFMTAVKNMVESYVADGNTLKAAKDYMTNAFTFEAYTEELVRVRGAEKQESNENLLADFAEVAEQLAAGETADVQATLRNSFETLAARYNADELGGWSNYLVSVKRLITEDASFDGSTSAIVAEMRAQLSLTPSFDQRLTSYCRTVVEEADRGNSIGVMGTVWAVASCFIWLWGAGILLIAAAKVLMVILTKHLMTKRDKGGIEEDPDVLLRVSHLKQYFRSGDYVNKAVDDVSFYVKKGEVFGLVGESGCGKTTTGRTIINLYDPTEGDVYFEGLRISSTQNGLPVLICQLRKERDAQVAKLREQLKENIHQNPEKASALKAEFKAEVKKIDAALSARIEQARDNALESSVEKGKATELYREKRKAELTREYEEDMKSLSGQAAEERKQRYETEMKVAAKDNIMTQMQMIFQDPIASINPRMTVREIIAEGLEIRGIRDKAYIDKKVYEMLELVGLVPEHADRYPHEFSGGQRQRIGIARAIVMEPDLIIADEPISALDVSIQAQVINLLNDLREKMGLTIMFIAHNLSVVKYFSDRIAVMYYGKIVEMTTSDELFAHPLHPYTKALLSAIPYPDPHYEKQRKRIEYNPTRVHDYTVDKPSLREITPGHYIHCNDTEFKAYQKELGL